MRRTETRRRAFAPVGMYLLGYRAKRRKSAVNALQRYAADDMRMRSGLCALSGDAQRVQDRCGRCRAGIRSAGAARVCWKPSRDLGKAKARRAGGRGVICNAWTCRTGQRTATGAAERYSTRAITSNAIVSHPGGVVKRFRGRRETRGGENGRGAAHRCTTARADRHCRCS